MPEEYSLSLGEPSSILMEPSPTDGEPSPILEEHFWVVAEAPQSLRSTPRSPGKAPP